MWTALGYDQGGKVEFVCACVLLQVLDLGLLCVAVGVPRINTTYRFIALIVGSEQRVMHAEKEISFIFNAFQFGKNGANRTHPKSCLFIKLAGSLLFSSPNWWYYLLSLLIVSLFAYLNKRDLSEKQGKNNNLYQTTML